MRPPLWRAGGDGQRFAHAGATMGREGARGAGRVSGQRVVRPEGVAGVEGLGLEKKEEEGAEVGWVVLAAGRGGGRHMEGAAWGRVLWST